jgi:hypothetical protein
MYYLISTNHNSYDGDETSTIQQPALAVEPKQEAPTPVPAPKYEDSSFAATQNEPEPAAQDAPAGGEDSEMMGDGHQGWQNDMNAGGNENGYGGSGYDDSHQIGIKEDG